jgi:hypothetical protein
MASFNKFNAFVEAVAEKKHNLGSDTLKIMLSNTAPSSANSVKADITEISAGNGYTAGGATVTITSSAQSSGLYKLIGNDVVFTATGAVGPLRYAVFYNSTATNQDLIGWWDYGSSVTLASGDTFTVDFDATNGILQLS